MCIVCQDGFLRNGTDCIDVDECSSGLNNCDLNADCFNSVGSYTCQCKEGFIGTGNLCGRGQCKDASCPENQKCISPNTFGCECKKGFEMDQSGECADIDECVEANDCDINAECENVASTYNCKCNSVSSGGGKTCSCNSGYEPDENGKCIDIDECNSKEGIIAVELTFS